MKPMPQCRSCLVHLAPRHRRKVICRECKITYNKSVRLDAHLVVKNIPEEDVNLAALFMGFAMIKLHGLNLDIEPKKIKDD